MSFSTRSSRPAASSCAASTCACKPATLFSSSSTFAFRSISAVACCSSRLSARSCAASTCACRSATLFWSSSAFAFPSAAWTFCSISATACRSAKLFASPLAAASLASRSAMTFWYSAWTSCWAASADPADTCWTCRWSVRTAFSRVSFSTRSSRPAASSREDVSCPSRSVMLFWYSLLACLTSSISFWSKMEVEAMDMMPSSAVLAVSLEFFCSASSFTAKSSRSFSFSSRVAFSSWTCLVWTSACCAAMVLEWRLSWSLAIEAWCSLFSRSSFRSICACSSTSCASFWLRSRSTCSCSSARRYRVDMSEEASSNVLTSRFACRSLSSSSRTRVFASARAIVSRSFSRVAAFCSFMNSTVLFSAATRFSALTFLASAATASCTWTSTSVCMIFPWSSATMTSNFRFCSCSSFFPSASSPCSAASFSSLCSARSRASAAASTSLFAAASDRSSPLFRSRTISSGGSDGSPLSEFAGRPGVDSALRSTDEAWGAAAASVVPSTPPCRMYLSPLAPRSRVNRCRWGRGGVTRCVLVTAPSLISTRFDRSSISIFREPSSTTISSPGPAASAACCPPGPSLTWLSTALAMSSKVSWTFATRCSFASSPRTTRVLCAATAAGSGERNGVGHPPSSPEVDASSSSVSGSAASAGRSGDRNGVGQPRALSSSELWSA